MSTHRKIEWALFVFGLVGVAASVWLDATVIQIGLFVVGTLFAGLHAFKMYDGHKSNHVVVATALSLVVYTGYATITSIESIAQNQAVIYGLLISVLLSILSLRLRRDFHKR